MSADAYRTAADPFPIDTRPRADRDRLVECIAVIDEADDPQLIVKALCTWFGLEVVASE